MEQQNQQPSQKDTKDHFSSPRKFRKRILILILSLFIVSSIIPLGADYTGLFCPNTPNTAGFLCLPTPTFEGTKRGLAWDYGFGFPFQFAFKQIDVGGYWSGYIWYPQSILANLIFWFMIITLSTVIIKKVTHRRTI